MGLITKIIQTFGEKTKPIEDSFGKQLLYPEGTKRLIKKYFFFSTKINEEEIKGDWIIEQTANIVCTCGSDGTLYYNSWGNTRAIEKYTKEKDNKKYIDNYLNPRLSVN